MNFRALSIAVVSAYFMLLFALTANAASVALIAADNSSMSHNASQKLRDGLSQKFHLIDNDLARDVFLSLKYEDPQNLTADQANKLGSSIGCDAFVIVNSGLERRSSSKRSIYFEAYASVFIVSTRTGLLLKWTLIKAEDITAATAASALDKLLLNYSAELSLDLNELLSSDASSSILPLMEEPPDAADADRSKNFQAPIPYRRIKPEYTTEAFFFGITATVEILVDISETGEILRSRIVRWAGYGLDESVDKAVREMKWRPAMRNGKPLPMRVLLRYNFKKIDKQDD